MSNLFRWGILPAFLMTFSGMSQDIAAPSMANVDLEMEDEKKIAAYREAMARHLQLGIIWTCIVELEEKDNRAVLVATLKYIQSPEWAGILDKCPSDYRAMHLKMIRESGKLLERVEREKMTADEIQNAYGKYGGQYMKMGGSILEKYRLENCSVQFSLYLMRETEGLDDKERLKALYRIRKDILSGKLKVPGEEGWANLGWRNDRDAGPIPGTVPELLCFLSPVVHFHPGPSFFCRLSLARAGGLGA